MPGVCRAAMERLLAEVAGVKGTWQGKLNEITAVVEDVVRLKKGQLEVSKLNQQQEELQEELKVLSRMLKLRETEIKSLETQLAQVRPLHACTGRALCCSGLLCSSTRIWFQCVSGEERKISAALRGGRRNKRMYRPVSSSSIEQQHSTATHPWTE